MLIVASSMGLLNRCLSSVKTGIREGRTGFKGATALIRRQPPVYKHGLTDLLLECFAL